MTVLDTAVVAVHHLFAALLVGSVLFVTYGVLPQAKEGNIGPDVLRTVFGKLRMVTRSSAVFLLLTGGYLGWTFYTTDDLLSTGRGWLVLTMVALWLVLTALVEITTSKFEDELDRGRLRGPAHEYTNWFYGASLLAVLLALVGGVLSWGIPL